MDFTYGNYNKQLITESAAGAFWAQQSRLFCKADLVWFGGQNDPVFDVLVSKLEGLAGWDLGSPAKAAVGHCTVWRSSRAWVAAGHGAGSSHTADFKEVAVIKNPSSWSPAIASNLTSFLCVWGTFHPSRSEGNYESQKPKKARTERHFSLFPRA